MGVRIARGLLATIRDEPDHIFVQVQGPSDFDAAVRALRSASRDIAELDGGWGSAPGLSPGDRNGPRFVTDVLPAGTGPFIMIDGGFTPYSVLRTIPTIVTRHLEAEGVAEAVVGLPSDDTLVGGLDYLPRAVVLHAFRPPIARSGGTALPENWINEALGWVAQGRAVDDELWGATGTVEFPIKIADLDRFVAQCQRLRTDVVLVAGRPPKPRHSKRRPEWSEHQIRDDVLERVGGSVRAARVGMGWVLLAHGGPDVGWSDLRQTMKELEVSDLESFFRQAWRQPVTTAIVTGDLEQRVRLASTTVHRGLVLAEAGSALGDDNTRSAFSHLCDIARAVAAAVPVIYAFVSLDPTLKAAVAEHHETEWTAPPPATVDPWRDMVPDVFPFQVLGRGHAERLGATVIGAGRLGHGAVELSFGDPVEWMPGTPSRAEAHRSAAALLAPLLVAGPEAS